MTELTDKTITEYITHTIVNLPRHIRLYVRTQYFGLKDYIKVKTQNGIKFIDCIDVYVFGICLINALVKLPDITPILDSVNDIFIQINTYLYKKQYVAEKSYISYEPDTKAVINSVINSVSNSVSSKDKGHKLHFLDSAPMLEPSEDTIQKLDALAIPKLDMNITTEAKLLKTTGLMNSEIAKLIGDGSFNNVCTLPLSKWSLSNQFVVRCRKSQDYDVCYYDGNSELASDINGELYKNFINKNSAGQDEAFITKYYLLYFTINDNRLINPMFLLNSIAHLEFKPGYLDNLKRALATPIKERYVFTFGTFSGFKSSVTDIIGHNHRCALIFDKLDSSIYFFDTLLDTATFTYMFEKNGLLNNSIDIACKYKFGSIDFINDNNYKFTVTDIKMQYHDVAYKDIIAASTYYRYYGYGKKHTSSPKYMDWSGGYCGAYILLLLVMMSINPHLDMSLIFFTFNNISKGPNANHNFLMVLIRSFAQQLENIIYKQSQSIQLDRFNVILFLSSNGVTIKLNNVPPIALEPGMHDYNVINPLNPTTAQEGIAKQIVRNSNKATLLENKDKIIGKKLQSIYLGNVSLMFTTIGAMFRKINKLQTELTQEQRQWQFEHYGPDDLVYFIKY
jgi:hypothetical protein